MAEALNKMVSRHFGSLVLLKPSGLGAVLTEKGLQNFLVI